MKLFNTLFLLFLFFAINGHSQNIIVNEGIFRINSTTTDVYFGYDYQNKSTGTHENKGNLHISKNFINDGAMTATDAINGTTHFIANSLSQEIKGTANQVIFKRLNIQQPTVGALDVSVVTETELRVVNQLKFNYNAGNLRLIGTAQLVQTHNGLSQVVKPFGGNFSKNKLFMDQTGVNTNVYQSGYWSSPVVFSYSNNFVRIAEILKDGTNPTTTFSNPLNINFTDIHTLDGAKTTPITISGRWLAKLTNALDWTRQISPGAENLQIGEGWNMKSTGGGTQNYTFKGFPNDGQQSLNIDDVKLYLIGNPYPSSLDANTFITDNTSAIAGTLYFYDSGNETTHVRGNYIGGYATYNGTTGIPFNGGATPSRYIPVGQAFFVYRDVANGGGTGTIGSSETIFFENSQRIFHVRDANSVFFSKSKQSKKTTSNNPLLKIGFEFNIDTNGNTFHRQLAVGFLGQTSGFENGYDAELFDKQPTDFALRIDNHASNFVISGRENFNDGIEVPLNFYLDKQRTVNITIDAQENFSNTVYLKDEQNFVPIYSLLSSTNPISLTLNQGDYTNRFSIVFRNTALPVVNIEENNFNIFFDNAKSQLIIQTKNKEVLKSLKLYSILGKVILENKSISSNNNNTYKIKLKHIKSGFYLSQFIFESKIISKKIIIKRL